jgi:hypothetical protein
MANENHRLNGLLLELHSDMANLRRENIALQEKLQGKPASDTELRLIKVAKQILKDLNG